MMKPKKSSQRWPPDYLPEYPIHALHEVWYLQDLDYVTGLIPAWYFVCVSHECASYYDIKEREDLGLFATDLLRLTEATYFFLKFKEEMVENPGKDPLLVKKELVQLPEGYWINPDDVENPIPTIVEFASKYDRSYVRLELWHFFEGVCFYNGPLEVDCPQATQNQWLVLHCVTEAAYVIASGNYTDFDGRKLIAPATINTLQ